MINVIDITNKGLTKNVYTFKVDGYSNHLEYYMFNQYNRDNKYSLWPDEEDKPMTWKTWAEANSLEYDPYDPSQEYKYESYERNNDPLRGKTIDGRPRSSGAAGYQLISIHPLPSGISARAREEFIKVLTVEGEE